jgi:hypothetical protein
MKMNISEIINKIILHHVPFVAIFLYVILGDFNLVQYLFHHNTICTMTETVM